MGNKQTKDSTADATGRAKVTGDLQELLNGIDTNSDNQIEMVRTLKGNLLVLQDLLATDPDNLELGLNIMYQLWTTISADELFPEDLKTSFYQFLTVCKITLHWTPRTIGERPGATYTHVNDAAQGVTGPALRTFAAHDEL